MNHYRAFLMALILAGIPLRLTAADQPYRTWTSSDGRTLEARYIKSTESTVTVRTREGRQLDLPFAKLTEADITAAVLEELKKGAKTITINLQGQRDVETPFFFASREANVGQPVLIVTP